MDPKLLQILKKAKAIDKAAENYDSVPNKQQVLGKRNSGGGGGGLFEQIGVTDEGGTPTNRYEPGSDSYNSAVDNSPLPDAIKQAMKRNPIAQPEFSGIDIDENDLKELRGDVITEEYSENDEYDFLEDDRPIQTQPNRRSGVKPKQIKEGLGVSESHVRKMIAEEIAKALPSIVEKYFDQKLISENVKILRKIKRG